MSQMRAARVAPEKAVFRPVLPFVTLPGFTEKRVDIKPIETKYNGYKFRSRLEARWAVFFDEIGAKYEYELEGYVLPDGSRYLPDFFLPEIGVHVEVKPNLDFVKDRTMASKLNQFAADADMPLLVIAGTPGGETMGLLSRQNLEAWATTNSEEDGDVFESLMMEALCYYGRVRFGTIPLSAKLHLVYANPDSRDWIIEKALQKAKQARFEHGQTPKVGR